MALKGTQNEEWLWGPLVPFPPLSEWQNTFAHVCVIFALTLDVGAGGWEHSEEAYGVCVCVCVSQQLTDNSEMFSVFWGWMAAILVVSGIFLWAGGISF